MPRHLKIFIGVLVLGLAGILAARFALPHLTDSLQRRTSDAANLKGTLRVGVDSWVGYFPLCSPLMASRMRAQGYVFDCEDDKADYPKRMQRLKDGELQMEVTTVDAFVLNGAPKEFPGAIVAVIDESKGGDAIVARRAVVPNLDALKKPSELHIALTPASPSEHLLKAVSSLFDLPFYKPGSDRRWRMEADGSSDALAKLKAGKADVAVLWEPDVSRALADPEFVELIGTQDTDKLIVDALVASRSLLDAHPEQVDTVLREYFETLNEYRGSPDRLRADLRKATGVNAEQVEAMLKGVSWATLNDNGALWFGVTPSGLPSEEGLVEALRSAVAVLVASGDFPSSPLPGQDPYRLTNRQGMSRLYLGHDSGGQAISGGDSGLSQSFAPLDDAGWARLTEVGTLKIEPIGFARGAATLDEDGHAAVTAIAERLKRFPRYRVFVRGHTSTGGDPAENLKLSRQRASAVAQELVDRFRVDPNRIRAVGYGGTRPLPQLADENDRAYAYRLPRVEITLASDGY